MINIFITDTYDTESLKRVLTYIFKHSKGEVVVSVEKDKLSALVDIDQTTIKLHSEGLGKGNLCVLINKEGLSCSYYRGAYCSIGTFITEWL